MSRSRKKCFKVEKIFKTQNISRTMYILTFEFHRRRPGGLTLNVQDQFESFTVRWWIFNSNSLNHYFRHLHDNKKLFQCCSLLLKQAWYRIKNEIQLNPLNKIEGTWLFISLTAKFAVRICRQGHPYKTQCKIRKTKLPTSIYTK